MITRQKVKGRRESGTFFGIPHAVMDHANYLRMTFKAVKLLNDIGRQYNGYNNGDLCVTYSLMKNRGWVSKGTLQEATDELLHYGLILLSRQGGRHKANLFAITWKPINECKGKIDISPTKIPLGNWKDVRDEFIPKRIIKKVP